MIRPNRHHERVVKFPGHRNDKVKSPSSVDRHVGMRVRQQRILAGLSQEKLAALLGITFQQVQKYEKGVNRIGSGRLQSIAQALGVPVSYFFEGHVVTSDDKETVLGSDVQAFLATREGVALARAFLKIEDGTLRRALVAMAQAVAKDA